MTINDDFFVTTLCPIQSTPSLQLRRRPVAVRSRHEIWNDWFASNVAAAFRLCSARGGPDLLHPGKARQLRSLLRDAIHPLSAALGFCSISLPKSSSSFFSSIPAIGGLLYFLWAVVQAIVQLAFLVILIIAMVKAFSGVRWDIPYVGPIARKQVGRADAVMWRAVSARTSLSWQAQRILQASSRSLR